VAAKTVQTSTNSSGCRPLLTSLNRASHFLPAKNGDLVISVRARSILATLQDTVREKERGGAVKIRLQCQTIIIAIVARFAKSR
jgi:hypothetical protein